MTDNIAEYGTAPVELQDHLARPTDAGSCAFNYRGFKILLTPKSGSVWAPEGPFVTYIIPSIAGIVEAVKLIDENIAKEWT